MQDLRARLQSQGELIRDLENEKLTLEENVTCDAEVQIVKPGKTFISDVRLAVYDGIVNQVVPTFNIPILISRFSARFGVPMDSVPHRNTVEMMARELGIIASLQTAEAIIRNRHVTLGFDATTQGVHINSIHITTEASCYVVAVNELPGGTAIDYADHICESIDNLSRLYSLYTEADYQQCHSSVVENISNCMMDRVVVNHAV